LGNPSHKDSFCAIVEFIIIMARFSNHYLPTGTAVLLIVAWFSAFVVTTTMAQFATCSNARALATDVLLHRYREPCQSNSDSCIAGIVCDQDCIDGSDSFFIACEDQCNSQALDGYTVTRSSVGGAGVGYLLSSAVLIIILTYTHTFSAGGVAAGTTLSNTYTGEATACVTEVIHESDVNIHSRDDVWLGIDHVTTGSLSDHEWNVLIVYD
jgi:hypothetical protein